MNAHSKISECAFPVELYWVGATNGAYLVADDQILAYIEYGWLNSNVDSLIEKLAAACGRSCVWRRDVDDLSEYLERMSVSNSVIEWETVQQLIDAGQLGCRNVPLTMTLEEKMFQPGVTPELIGRNIRKERKARGLTVDDLAERAGLDAAAVLAYEHGSGLIFGDQLVRIAGALGVADPEMLLEC